VEKPKEDRVDSTASETAVHATNLNGDINSLSIEDTAQPNGKEWRGGDSVPSAKPDTHKIFASVSVADKIRAWEQNATS
jgi:hypothetical protein